MSKIPTAEDFKNWSGFTEETDRLIEFAKLHVKAALKEASEKANLYLHNSGWKHSSDIKTVKCHNYDASINKVSVLNAYPLENIK
jgi:hypothetical protein